MSCVCPLQTRFCIQTDKIRDAQKRALRRSKRTNAHALRATGTRSPTLSSDPQTQGCSEHRRHRQSAQSPYAQSEKHYGRREDGEVGVISHALANGPRESAFPMREHDREWCAHRETQKLHPAQRVRERVVHERVGAGRKRRGAPATHVLHTHPETNLGVPQAAGSGPGSSERSVERVSSAPGSVVGRLCAVDASTDWRERGVSAGP